MRRRMKTALHACTVSLIVAAVMAPAQASAQQTINFSIGGFSPRPEDARNRQDVLVQDRSFLDFNIGDLSGATVGGEWLIGLGDNFDAGLGVGFFQHTTLAADRFNEFQGTGEPIVADLGLNLDDVRQGELLATRVNGDAAATGLRPVLKLTRGPARDGRGPRCPAVGISVGCLDLRHCYMTRYCWTFSLRRPPAALAGDAGPGVHAGRGSAGPFRRGGDRGLVTLRIRCRGRLVAAGIRPRRSFIASSNEADLESLLPDVWIAAHPEHFLTYRRNEAEAAAIARRRRRERRGAKAPEHSRSP